MNAFSPLPPFTERRRAQSSPVCSFKKFNHTRDATIKEEVEQLGRTKDTSGGGIAVSLRQAWNFWENKSGFETAEQGHQLTLDIQKNPQKCIGNLITHGLNGNRLDSRNNMHIFWEHIPWVKLA